MVDPCEGTDLVVLDNGNNNLTHRFVFSPRTGRQRKAWGVSPRSSTRFQLNPRSGWQPWRLIFVQMIRLPPASRASSFFLTRSWGSRPRLYAGVRSADSRN